MSMTMKKEINKTIVETILESHMRINQLWEAAYTEWQKYMPKLPYETKTLNTASEYRL
jgi:hypothetical protein